MRTQEHSLEFISIRRVLALRGRSDPGLLGLQLPSATGIGPTLCPQQLSIIPNSWNDLCTESRVLHRGKAWRVVPPRTQ
jgi:hypothetical protein